MEEPKEISKKEPEIIEIEPSTAHELAKENKVTIQINQVESPVKANANMLVVKPDKKVEKLFIDPPVHELNNCESITPKSGLMPKLHSNGNYNILEKCYFLLEVINFFPS